MNEKLGTKLALMGVLKVPLLKVETRLTPNLLSVFLIIS